MSIKEIDNFFSNLSDRSITVCHSCSEKNVLSKRRPSDLGYCFYRPHEKIFANETGVLYLSWGTYTTDQMEMLIVVNAILDEAKACSLTAKWEGSMNDRVVIEKLDKNYFK